MKKLTITFLVLGCIGLLAGLVYWYASQPYDLKADFHPDQFTQEEIEQGKSLISAMQDACGGMNTWKSYDQAMFTQVADWYGRKPISGWDTLPQLFEMTSILGSNDATMILKNGPTAGSGVKWQDGQFYLVNSSGQEVKSEPNHFLEKLIYKTYWFQFPFRISEAEFIGHAGQKEVDGINYDLVYATWGSEAVNETYDQFILYLHPETHLLHHLHFTVRERLSAARLSARFEDYREVDGFRLPFSMYVTNDAPEDHGVKMHENHYQSIRFRKMDE